MDSRVVQAGDVVLIEYQEYWSRRRKHDTQGNMIKHHTEWGLGPINKYNQSTNTYELMVVDPRMYMLKCIEYGW
jgi:hypothetical protein